MEDTATVHHRPSAPPLAPEEAPTSTPATTTSGRPSATSFESLAVAGFVFGLFAVVIAVFAVGLAARAVSEAGGGGAVGGGDAPATLEVSATEFTYDPSEAEISSTGTITISNDGSIDHDLVIDDLTTDVIAPGATGELVLEGLSPGEYEYYCSIPGHRDAGMEGRILVG